MSAETTKTSLTEIVNSEIIADMILMYAADATVIAPLCRFMDLAGQGSGTASFPQWELDAVADVSDGSAFSGNTELQTTEVATISVGTVGVLREVTDFAFATNVMGEQELRRFIVEDGAALCMLEVENDLAALFSGFSSTVGTSGQDLSVANFVQAIATMDTLKARGRKVCVLDDQQAYDLRAAVAASTGTVFANAAAPQQTVLNARSDAYVGELFGVPIWLTNLTDTANTNADVVGAMFVDGSTDPRYAALGLVSLWMPRAKTAVLVDSIADQIAITQAYGVGRISGFGLDITTDA